MSTWPQNEIHISWNRMRRPCKIYILEVLPTRGGFFVRNNVWTGFAGEEMLYKYQDLPPRMYSHAQVASSVTGFNVVADRCKPSLSLSCAFFNCEDSLAPLGEVWLMILWLYQSDWQSNFISHISTLASCVMFALKMKNNYILCNKAPANLMPNHISDLIYEVLRRLRANIWSRLVR